MLFEKKTYLAIFIIWLIINLQFNEMMYYMKMDEFTYSLMNIDKLYFITRYGLIIMLACAELLAYHIKEVIKRC